MQYDYIIAGQGLAGSLLSYFLYKNGKTVLVADPGGSNASRVAAGLYNPITGRRMHKSWMVEELLPIAENTYGDMEQRLGASFWHPVPMLRLFPSAEERQASLQKLEDSDGKVFIDECFDEYAIEGLKKLSFGACVIKSTGYLDTEVFLTAWRNFLRENGMLAEEKIDYPSIQTTDGGVTWKSHAAAKLIFCEGYRGQQNPWFAYLPWNPAKGEILEIKAPGLQLDKIINKNMYLVPIAQDVFRLGATYSWDDMTEETTKKGKEELLAKLEQLIDVPYEVIGHKAGIRPAVRHRRPFLGLHPERPELGIFNGLGTKGVLLAPYFASHMTDFLLGAGALMEEVNIRKFS